ncbi:hypothetical protein ACFONN_21235 [Dyella humi]|uniref:Uncharacterized protein n=1 Tax=Dyella humi TaxID=1770547 RepID=A0ABW8IHW7_9GAMM
MSARRFAMERSSSLLLASSLPAVITRIITRISPWLFRELHLMPASPRKQSDFSVFEAAPTWSCEGFHALQAEWIPHSERSAVEAFIGVPPTHVVDRATRKANPAHTHSLHAVA